MDGDSLIPWRKRHSAWVQCGWSETTVAGSSIGTSHPVEMQMSIEGKQHQWSRTHYPIWVWAAFIDSSTSKIPA